MSVRKWLWLLPISWIRLHLKTWPFRPRQEKKKQFILSKGRERKMSLLNNMDDLKELVEKLNFKEKVERSLALIKEAYQKYGDSMVVANSLGKDSVCVWDLAKKASPKIRGFIVTTRFKPKETIQFMNEMTARYPELNVYKSDVKIPDKLYETDPDKCCDLLKVKPTS